MYLYRPTVFIAKLLKMPREHDLCKFAVGVYHSSSIVIFVLKVVEVDYPNLMNTRGNVNDSRILIIIIIYCGLQLRHQEMCKQEMTDIVH